MPGCLVEWSSATRSSTTRRKRARFPKGPVASNSWASTRSQAAASRPPRFPLARRRWTLTQVEEVLNLVLRPHRDHAIKFFRGDRLDGKARDANEHHPGQ